MVQILENNRKSVCGVIFAILLVTLLVAYQSGFRPIGDYMKHKNYSWTGISFKDKTEDSNLIRNNSSNWVVVSMAVKPDMSFYYAFCLPITVLAWNRVGWSTVVIVMGDLNRWRNSKLLQLVKNTTDFVDPSTVFLEIPITYNSVSYAQIARMFVAILTTTWMFEGDLIMTSDIDIIPINKALYDKTKHNDITVLNSDCCGNFTWENGLFVMRPMTSVCMSVNNWINVMDLRLLRKNETFQSYTDQWLIEHYGSAVGKSDIVKGGNNDWFMDQRVLSLRLYFSDIKQTNIPRSMSDRADRSDFDSWQNFNQKNDSHLFLPAFNGRPWNATLELLKYLFSHEQVDILEDYRVKYVDLLTAQSA